mmetsp:Transcript_1647/g.1453  ORF Transcript_1647/g.1453 Transcript_1647/m.1453 type:complete len:128 (-) Transcript_1647:837-1220(-)
MEDKETINTKMQENINEVQEELQKSREEQEKTKEEQKIAEKLLNLKIIEISDLEQHIIANFIKYEGEIDKLKEENKEIKSQYESDIKKQKEVSNDISQLKSSLDTLQNNQQKEEMKEDNNYKRDNMY